jgi:trimethylamine-N-oxide reductase (cytochrome c)
VEVDMAVPDKRDRVLTNCTSGGPVRVYVNQGKMTRIEPLELEKGEGHWAIDAKGRTFSPPSIARISPYTLAERSRTYGSNRILYPLKRVDFDPKGDRKPENRGKSSYQKISWNEALDILTDETKRIQSSYGPGAILTTTSSHHNWGNIGYRFSAHARFMSILGAIAAEHNPDSWEGWHWGSIHHWGYAWRLGLPEQYDLLEDALKNSEMIVFGPAIRKPQLESMGVKNRR